MNHKLQTRRQSVRGNLKSFFLRFSAIPFVLTYGMLLHTLFKYILLSDSSDPNNLQSTCCEEAFNIESLLAFNATTDYPRNTNARKDQHGDIMPRQTYPQLFYVSSTLTVTIGITSIISHGVRCSITLFLPGLIVPSHRTMKYVFMFTILLEGPINTLGYNLNEILRYTSCVYDVIWMLICKNTLQLETTLEHVRVILKQFEKIFDHVFLSNKMFPSKIPLQAEYNWLDRKECDWLDRNECDCLGRKECDWLDRKECDWLDRKECDLLGRKECDWLDRKECTKALYISKGNEFVYSNMINNCRKYFTIPRKILTTVLLLVMVMDAVRYLPLYYSDNSYDNAYIDETTHQLWKGRKYKSILPLRHWELTEGYKAYNSSKLRKQEELKRSFYYAVPSLLFSLLAVGIMVADYLVADMTEDVLDDSTIIFKRVTHTFGELKSFKLSNPCLPHPMHTLMSHNLAIIILLILHVISHFYKEYISRVRSNICNLFYPHRAVERAEYLRHIIQCGRINRKLNFALIVERELERRKCLGTFCPLSKLKGYICCKRTNNIVCPGCGYIMKPSTIDEKYMVSENNKISAQICEDCRLDI